MKTEYFIEPTKEILKKCIDSSCVITIDKMLDNSMMREVSERGISYIFENISSIIHFEIDDNAVDFRKKYSANNVRVKIEIRDNDNHATYLVEMTIAVSHKDEILQLISG